MKLAEILHHQRDRLSPPAWGRGLKQLAQLDGNGLRRSPPAWGRGLKPVKPWVQVDISRRPPRGGVD